MLGRFDEVRATHFYVHAQKDLDLLTENNRTEVIRNDSHLTVENHRFSQIEAADYCVTIPKIGANLALADLALRGIDVMGRNGLMQQRVIVGGLPFYRESVTTQLRVGLQVTLDTELGPLVFPAPVLREYEPFDLARHSVPPSKARSILNPYSQPKPILVLHRGQRMTNAYPVSESKDAAFRATEIGPLPEAPTKRIRVGEELQPIGCYAGIIPYLATIQDVEALQSHEKNDPEFKDRGWWWDHQRIRFLSGKMGMKFLILLFPIAWALTVVIGGLASIVWAIVQLTESYGLPAFLHILLLLTLVPGWFILSFWIIPPSINWIMGTALGFVIRPFEEKLGKKFDESLEDGCSEFNRVTGQVRIALGHGRYFEAPFVEFDAYVDRVIQQSGVFFRLILVHRYTQKTFNNTAFSTIEANKNEVLATWDMLQRYMDVSQPLPDVPRLEPFRHLDPVTVQHDSKIGRAPRYWRDLDLESWESGEGWVEVRQRQSQFAWASRRCKLTPQLGKISMEEYRKLRPAEAWPI